MGQEGQLGPAWARRAVWARKGSSCQEGQLVPERVIREAEESTAPPCEPWISRRMLVVLAESVNLEVAWGPPWRAERATVEGREGCRGWAAVERAAVESTAVAGPPWRGLPWVRSPS